MSRERLRWIWTSGLLLRPVLLLKCLGVLKHRPEPFAVEV